VGSDQEHNSNLLPWLALARRGMRHRAVPFGDLDALRDALGPEVKLVAMVLTSNLDGASIDAAAVVDLAHRRGVPVLLDAAQAVPHRAVDVRALDVDFLACSGHKMLGPSGTGILYGKRFMVVFGLISSLFDLMTFAALRWVFRAGQATFQTFWFVVSLLTELAVVLVLRTHRPALRSTPSRLLLWSTVAVGGVTITIPFLGVRAPCSGSCRSPPSRWRAPRRSSSGTSARPRPERRGSTDAGDATGDRDGRRRAEGRKAGCCTRFRDAPPRTTGESAGSFGCGRSHTRDRNRDVLPRTENGSRSSGARLGGSRLARWHGL